MNQKTVTMVRVYLTEGEAQLDTLMRRLHDWEKASGVTVFRGISGYGESGQIHPSGLLDMAMNLPVVVEFFDEPNKAEAIVEHLDQFIKPGHIVTWDVRVNMQ